jgi:Mat/Ecp fimbriae outer membrane usher protein
LPSGNSTGWRWRSAQSALVVAPLSLLAVHPAAQAAAANNSKLPRIELSEPPGFSALTGAQSVVADIYFGGKRIGEARVTYQPGSLTFADPAKLVAMLPDMIDAPAVLAALSGPDLASNPQLVCTPGTDPAACGRLAPQVAGIIFDQDRFRIDVYVNPMLMTVREAVGRKYMQRPDKGLSLVNAISGVLAGSSQGPRNYNVQNHLIIGDADRRIRAELAYASHFGMQADRLVLEIDKPERRYMAGAFWAPGTDLVGRRKILGIGIESQIDTRLDKDEIWGNPLVVFLNQRARVDIVRDGRVLTSRIYDAGNQTLDTRALPNGSYEVSFPQWAKRCFLPMPGSSPMTGDERSSRQLIPPSSRPALHAG